MPQYPPPLLVINDTMSAAWVLRHDATVELEVEFKSVSMFPESL